MNYDFNMYNSVYICFNQLSTCNYREKEKKQQYRADRTSRKMINILSIKSEVFS